MISGIEPQRNASTGVPHAMALVITSPNGSGQSTGNNRAAASPKNLAFSRSLISPMNSTPGPSISEYLVAEVLFIDLVHLGCDLQWDASSARNPDCAIRTLF